MTVRSRPLLLGLLATLLAVIAIASFFYRPDSIKQYLIQQVELQLGRKIEVGEARLRLFPRVRLTLSDVIIRDLDPSRNFFSAKQVDLIIRSTPLWQFKVVVKRLTLDQPRMELRRDAAGHWNFLNAAESGGGGSGGAGGSGRTGEGGNPLGLLLLIQQTTLTGGELSVVDEFRPDGPRSFRMTMLDAAIATGLKDTLADVRLAATIPAQHGVTSLSLNGKLTRPEPPAQPLIGEPGHPPAVQFQGRAEALNVDIRHAADFFAPRPIPERLHGATNLRGTISITPGVGGYDLVLSDMTAGMGQLSLRGQASLSGLMTVQPTFSLTFSSAPVGLDELLDWFPIQWVNPQLAAIVEDREVGGLIEVVSATLTGTVKPELRASLTGELRLQRGHALVGSDRTQVENLSGTVIVESDRIKVTNVAGRYGPLRMSGGKGTVSFLTPGPWLDLEVTGEMAASDLAVTLGNAVTSASLSKSFRDLRKVQGNSVVTFRMAGSLNDFGALKFLGGEVLAQNLGFHSPLAPEPILGVNGRITFAPKGVVFDGISGRLGEGRFELQGTIGTEAAAVFKEFTVRASANVAQVMKWFPATALSKTVLHGAVGATVDLSGPMDTPLIKAEVELKDAALNFSQTMQKAVGTPASLKFEATLSRNRQIAFDRFELHLPPLQITGRGTVRLGHKFAVDASLASNQVSLASLPKGMSLGSVEAGTLEVSLDVKGKGTDWKVWQITGWVALTDGRVAAQDLDGPLSGVYLRLHLIRNGAEIKRLAFKIKDSDVSLSGSIRNWDKTPIISVKATSSHLDIDLLVPKGERSPIRDVLEDLAATSRLAATLDISRGLYKTLRFRDLSSQLTIQDGTVAIDNLRGETDGGTIDGHLKVRLPKLKPADVQASFRLADVPYEKVLQLTGDKQSLITGSLSTTVVLQGNGRDPQGVLHSLNGKVDVLVKQGRIQKGRIVPKILKILNLPALLQGTVDLSKDGLPFDKITSTLSVVNGIVTTENFLVDSPILKITGAGNYDLTTDRMHAVMATSPLGSYSKLLKSIPLFGKLFAGERQGIDTAFFEVTGPLKDPQVAYMPIKSLTTGLTGLGHLAFDLLKNTIMLPKELISPSDEPPPTTGKDTTPPIDQEPEPAAPAVPAPAVP